jgi:hypothetical protein
MDIVDFDSLVQQIKARRVRTVTVNGHGETTMIPGWHQKVMRIADEGLCMSIITNFARLLRQEELEAMARISEIMLALIPTVQSSNSSYVVASTLETYSST